MNYNEMTLRDYFASKAMQAMLTIDDGNDFINPKYKDDRKLNNSEIVARYAYQFADEMLKEREKCK